MPITFKYCHLDGTKRLISSSPEADALFELLAPKKHIMPKDLAYVARMGLEWAISDGSEYLPQELRRLERER